MVLMISKAVWTCRCWFLWPSRASPCCKQWEINKMEIICIVDIVFCILYSVKVAKPQPWRWEGIYSSNEKEREIESDEGETFCWPVTANVKWYRNGSTTFEHYRNGIMRFSYQLEETWLNRLWSLKETDVIYLKLSSAYEKETYSWNKQNNQYKGAIYTKQKPPSLLLLNHSW